MNTNNFRCPDTNEEFYFNVYKLLIGADGSKVYKDKYGKQLVNAKGTPLEWLDRGFEGFCTTTISNKAQSRRKTQQYLEKRSKDHFKKNIAPKKRGITRSIVNALKTNMKK